MNKLLAIGYGSIGARHSRLANAKGWQVACVTSNETTPFQRFGDVSEAIRRFVPDRILIANETSRHAAVLVEIAESEYSGPVLVEKPLFAQFEELSINPLMQVFVAYNLRFHPLVRALRSLIAEMPLHSANFHAGQHLPQWRPNTDYRQSYSAQRAKGGGVLRDLSHEIDLALWLCGPARQVTALGGHFSDLEIDSDDVFSTLSSNQRCPMVAISVNYLDQVPRRSISINAQDSSITVDLIANSLTVKGKTTHYKVHRDDTYNAQLEAFLNNDTSTLCTYDQGRDVVRFIASAEQASFARGWITL